jgi:hypothetical protein
MRVRVDQTGYHGLAREGHALGARWNRDRRGGTRRHDTAIAHDDRGVGDRLTVGAVDQPDACECRHRRRLLRGKIDGERSPQGDCYREAVRRPDVVKSGTWRA